MIVLGTVIGTLVDFTPLDPISALLWTAVMNGVIALPIMAVMMMLGARRDVLSSHALSLRHRMLGWLATAAMLGAVVVMVVSG